MKKLENINSSLFTDFQKNEVAGLENILGGKPVGGRLNTCNNGCTDYWTTTNADGRGDGTYWDLDGKC